MKGKAVVEKIYERTSDTTCVPTLLKFQNGDLTAANEGSVQYSRVVNESRKTKEALVFVNKEVYRGPINASTADELTDTYVCVRNKVTNKVRILPINVASLKNQVYTVAEQPAAELPVLNQQLMAQKLLKEFGGRKASRYLDNQEKMIVSMDVLKDNLDNTIKDTSVDTINEQGNTTDRLTHYEIICPKYKADAAQLEEVYDIKDVVPASFLERLDKEAKAVYSASIQNLPIASQYLRNQIASVQCQKVSSPQNLERIKIILFMDGLFNVMKVKSGSLRKRELSKISAKIENYVRNNFSDSAGRYSALTFQKALCHYIVLAVLLNEKHEVDAAMLAQELGHPVSTITKFAHIANITPKEYGKTCLVLRLPSKVEPIKTRSRKK